MSECTNYSFNSLTSKTFELPSHDLINLSFRLWMVYSVNYSFYLYVDNELYLLIQTSLHSFTNDCSSYGSYKISENIVHSSSSVQITMVSDWQSWGFSEFNLNAINITQKIWELAYQSLNQIVFFSISQDDGWMTNGIVSQQREQCTDFNYLRSTGNYFIKDFVLQVHNKISLNLKVLIFNKASPTISIKIDNQQVATKSSNSYVQSSATICSKFIVIQLQISDFVHNNQNLRIEITTSADGTISWFGIRDFSLFTDIIEDYQCKDLNILPFDGCFSNQYDCNFGCSNCVKGICINCLDGWYLHTKNTCIPICGDNMLMLNEVCDDGNSIPYDGCHNCQFSCPLNCILCVFGTCQECQQSYFYIENRCISEYQISENFFEKIETGLFENWIYDLEKNDFQSENLVEQLEAGFFNNWSNYLEKNDYQCYQNLVEKLQTGFLNNWANYLEKNGYQCQNLRKQLEDDFFNNWINSLYQLDSQSEDLIEQLETGCFNNWSIYLETNDYQCYQSLVEKLQTGFFDYWTNYLEKHGFYCENLIKSLEAVFLNNLTNYLNQINFQSENFVEQLGTGFFNNWSIYLETNNFQCYQSLVEKLQTGFLNNWTNYVEKNGFQCENLIKQLAADFFNNMSNYLDQIDSQSEDLVEQLETGFFNNWSNYLEKNDYQCYQNLVEKLQTGFLNNWANYLEKNGYQCQNIRKQLEDDFFNNWTNSLDRFESQSEDLIEQLETGFFNNWINYLEKKGFQCQLTYQQQLILQQSQQYNLNQNNLYGLDIISSFSICYFSDNLIIQEQQQDSKTECKKGYKLSPSKRQCVEICNCQDLVSLQNNDCYNCVQNCQLECLICLQDKCYACFDGWQLVDHKCQQICGDKQVALYTYEQCDDGNQSIDDGCHECQFQCGLFCQFCDKELNCLKCEQNFNLVNNICQPICGDKIVITGLEECDDGNEIKYDGCYECQFQCSFGCKVCESGKCQDICKVEEEFINGQCILIVPFESEEIESIQSECKNNCLVCDGANCLLCKRDYILENNKCFSCGNGIITKDEECDDGNRINSDGCSKQCKIEKDWNCIDSLSFLSQCFPVAKISIVLLNSTFNSQYVKLSYSNQVKLNQQDINFLDFNVNSINVDPTYYNISIFPVMEIVSNETRFINYELKIEIYQQLSQNPILDVKVDLILLDENNLPVPPSSAQIVLTAPLVLNQAQVEVSQNFQKFGKFCYFCISSWVSLIIF
ncbi:unnamed protein product [Paramecium octaurelia]|uniref:Uncharacterized protein n=1 Tax=Paramecium octaurelia TaxID=43137 RepID=A0A8S1UPG7_PAROT|nr:unnamed protein product [Paramecium octaurelia]